MALPHPSREVVEAVVEEEEVVVVVVVEAEVEVEVRLSQDS